MSNKKSFLSGMFITSGAAIGAGMFSLPLVSSGMWFGYSLICLVLLWFLNYLCASYIQELCMRFEPGASFDTITREILGGHWNKVMLVLIIFLLYILLYAFYSGFSALFSSWDGINGQLTDLFRLLTGLLIGFFVWVSTGVVGRLAGFMVLGMVFCFLWSVFDLGQGLEPSNLLPIFDGDQGYHNYIWSALPYYMTSFGFVAVVPSLYKYYKDDAKAINKSIFWGSLLSLIVFFVFILLAFGNIDRDTFETLNTSESPLTAFLAQLTGGPDGGQSGRMISLFTNLAIVSSFMGTGLGLFDYISDKLQFGDTSMDRLKVALLTFLPPGLASFLFPNGFIAAIGFAGIVYVIGFFILSFFMVKKSRANQKAIRYKVFGGNLILYFFLLLSILILVTYILTKLNILPQW